jgi:myo-inositol-1(or 4)-monophosphatase
MTGELRAYLHTAIRAAKAAAHVHKSNIGQDLSIRTKTTITDLVTRVDADAERVIRECITHAHPGHVVLGEEEGLSKGESPYRWIIDPLDGTLNYAHGFPFYCVSIGLEIDGELQVGVVLDSARDELFTTWRGGGAWLNGAPVRVSDEDTLQNAMLATGFAYDPVAVSKNIEVFTRVMPKVRAVRRPGAAALDLAYVACGRLDGFWELKLNPWDVAAGVLMVSEAGGKVTSPSGGPYSIEDRVLVSSNGRIHEPFLEALALA